MQFVHVQVILQIIAIKAMSNDLVLLGETDEYEPLSRAAYYKAMLREKVSKLDVQDPEDISSKKQA